ncbi:DUF4870 domain-containing protein [Dermabacteraceae bacterium TAE3-ERU27]|nr:DUF4870 domain-containing protein [Dermabacteraceae bacterium TAE3-ERU27]
MQQQNLDPMAGDNERMLAILAHGSCLIGLLLGVGMLGFVGPLILWFMYKDKSQLVRGASASSLNFSITMAIASFVMVIFAITIVLLPVALVGWLVLAVMSIVFPVLGMMKASNNEIYNYPVNIPIVK